MKKLLLLITSSYCLLSQLQPFTLEAADCCPPSNNIASEYCVPPCTMPCDDSFHLGFDQSDFYFGALGGVNFVSTCEHDSEELDFDAGYYVGAVLGYRWDCGLRTEFEFTWRYNNLHNFRTFSTTFDTGGNLRRMSYMANAIYDFNFPSLCWPISPYIGAGVGYDHAQISVRDFFLDSEGRKKGLAWQVLAGIGYDIIPNWTFSIDYRLHKGREDIYNNAIGVSSNYFF